MSNFFQHPADGFYLIEPTGEHLNRAASVTQVIDDYAKRQIVDTFNAEASQPSFAGMLVDREHFKHDISQESRAYGWLLKLDNRWDGIYGQIRWTTSGRAAVDGGDYRFFSTEYDLEDCQPVGPSMASPRRVRPTRLAGLTLTNMPNNQGGRPITNRSAAGPEWCAAPIPNMEGVARVVAEAALDLVRHEQARSGRDFTAAWNTVMADHPMLPRIMNRGLGLGSLWEIEPSVKAEFAAAYQAAAAQYTGWIHTNMELDAPAGPIIRHSKLGALLNEIAVAHPKANFDERWDIAKRQAPEHFWAYIAENYAGIAPFYRPGRHIIQYLYRNKGRAR